MAGSVSCGIPAWVDGPSLDANQPFRTYDVGTRVLNLGTATAVAVPGGVYSGLGAMGVSAASGLSVQVAAGYCCVPSPTANNGGYIFGTAHNILPDVPMENILALVEAYQEFGKY